MYSIRTMPAITALLLIAQPAMADPTPENWARWATRADMISNMPQNPGATGDPAK